jgi:glycosyltransferase involved in cell wall biosynthesis
MRIGIDARFVREPLIGVGRYSLELINKLEELDKENTYIVFKDREYAKRITHSPNFEEVPIRWSPISLGTWFNFSLALYKKKIDILHSHFYITPLFHSFRLIVTVHDFHALLVPGFLGHRNYLLEKAAYLFHIVGIYSSIRRASRIIFVSNHTKADALRLYGRIPENRVIYEASSDGFKPVADKLVLKDLRKRYKLPGRYLLYLGNTKPHKNLSSLLYTYYELKKIDSSMGQIKLVIAGKQDRFFSDVKEIVSCLRLEKDVVLLGNVLEDDLPALYSAADLFVFLGTKEGFGLPVIEAMACGLPVVVADTSSLPEVVGDCGVMVPPHDPASVAREIHRLLKDKGLRNTLSRKGVARARSFSWENAARETLGVYEEVFAGVEK